MQAVPTLTMAYCRVLTDYLRARGHALAPVLQVLGVSEAELGDADWRIPRVRFNAALEQAIELSEDPFIGLHAGEQVRPAHYGVLGHVMMSCETSRHVIERHRQWHQLVARGEIVEYEETKNLVWLRESLPGGKDLITRAGVECNMAATLTYARWLFGRDIVPAELHFPYPAPADLAEYRRVFRCPMRFDADGLALAIHGGMLDAALPQANPELRQLMEARAARQAAELGLDGDEFLGQLRKVIAARLPQAAPDMDAAAAAMNISARTLQRRLAERGTHYKRALDDTRRDLALSYVRDPQLSLMDAVLLLGFSEQSAFHRAFRRWTGTTPNEYRDSARAGPKR